MVFAALRVGDCAVKRADAVGDADEAGDVGGDVAGNADAAGGTAAAALERCQPIAEPAKRGPPCQKLRPLPPG
ncbi:MAG: hypothetical protein ACKVOB_06705 [Sphingomonas sp.]